MSWVFYLTAGLLVHLCENASITAEIGSSNGDLGGKCFCTQMISLNTFILQIQHCSRWKRLPTTPSVREDRVQLGKSVCFPALLHFLASN